NDLLILAPQAFAYYLPAYLIATVEEPEAIDLALDAVVLSLTAPEPDDAVVGEWFEERFDRLTPLQREAARRELEFIAITLSHTFSRSGPQLAVSRWPKSWRQGCSLRLARS